MTPIETAAAVYASEPCARSFREDLEAHLLGGHVHSTPTAFVMARPVMRAADYELLTNPWVTWRREDADAWLVYLAAGDVAEMLGFLPFPLPWIGWERDNRLRWHGFESALARLQRRFHS